MKNSICSAATIGMAALFAGCGGSQPPIAIPAATVQGPATARQSNREGSGGDIIYAINGSQMLVLTYPEGQVVGKVDSGGNGICSDSKGNVFVTSAGDLDGQDAIYEYDHGGTNRIAELAEPLGDAGFGCARDPLTGDLAVVDAHPFKSNVAIFRHAVGNARVYTLPDTDGVSAEDCTYDDAGNLFVDIQAKDNRGIELLELPRHGRRFEVMSLNDDFGLTNVGIVQWDGKHVVIQLPNRDQLYQLSISGIRAKVVRSIHLRHSSWATWIVGHTVISGYRGAKFRIGSWRYPEGGNAYAFIPFRHFRKSITALTVSVAPTR